MLAKNAAIFEQVSIKLARVQGITKTFYAGVADKVGVALLPLLDRLEKINLVKMGQQFGAAIADGANVLNGAFEMPETAFELIRSRLAFAFTSAGNVLLASLKTAADFFATGMVASLDGIGSAIVATLMKSFDGPIRYFQAALESQLSIQQNIADKKEGKKTDFERFRQMSPEAIQGRIDQLRHLIANPSKKTTLDQQGFFRTQLDRTREYQLHPDHFVQPFETTDEVLGRHKNDPTRLGMYGGGQTAEEWRQRSRDGIQNAFSAAKLAAGQFKVDDVLGASRYEEDGLVAAAKLRRRKGGAADADATPGSGLSKFAQDRITAQAHMALANSHAPAGADPAAYMDTAPRIASLAWMRTNASDPYTARVDAARVAAMRAQHTIGVGGALDFDPSNRDDWTGARDASNGLRPGSIDGNNYRGTSGGVFKNSTSLTTGGLGGGAYGKTGNIWSQISGRVAGGKNPTEQIAGHIASIREDIKALRTSVESGGSSSGGGGGATTTGK